MKTRLYGFLAFGTAFLISTEALSTTSTQSLTGRWEVTTTYPGGSFVAGLDLVLKDGLYSGKSGYLVPDGYWYKYSGALQNDGLHLQILGPDGKTGIGNLVLNFREGSLSGKGVIHDLPVTVSARRPLQRPANATRVHHRSITRRSLAAIRRRFTSSPATPFGQRLSTQAVVERMRLNTPFPEIRRPVPFTSKAP